MIDVESIPPAGDEGAEPYTEPSLTTDSGDAPLPVEEAVEEKPVTELLEDCIVLIRGLEVAVKDARKGIVEGCKAAQKRIKPLEKSGGKADKKLEAEVTALKAKLKKFEAAKALFSGL